MLWCIYRKVEKPSFKTQKKEKKMTRVGHIDVDFGPMPKKINLSSYTDDQLFELQESFKIRFDKMTMGQKRLKSAMNNEMYERGFIRKYTREKY